MPLVIVADLGLLVAAFASAYIALGWAEMGSFPLHGDKSALGGLLAVMLFMVFRWSLLAAVLGIAAARGGFPFLPGSRTVQVLLVLGVHLALGLASYRGFNWVNEALLHDELAPRRLAWVFAFLLPLPSFLAAFWGLYRGWVLRHPVLAVMVLAAFGWLHHAGWHQGYRRPATEPVAQAAGPG